MATTTPAPTEAFRLRGGGNVAVAGRGLRVAGRGLRVTYTNTNINMIGIDDGNHGRSRIIVTVVQRAGFWWKA